MTKTRFKVNWRDFHSYIELEAHILGPDFVTASAWSALCSREYKYRANNFLETTLIWSFVFVLSLLRYLQRFHQLQQVLYHWLHDKLAEYLNIKKQLKKVSQQQPQKQV